MMEIMQKQLSIQNEVKELTEKLAKAKTGKSVSSKKATPKEDKPPSTPTKDEKQDISATSPAKVNDIYNIHLFMYTLVLCIGFRVPV